MTNAVQIQREDEDAIRRVVQDMQDAQNTRDAELFASAFAQELAYCVWLMTVPWQALKLRRQKF